MMVSIKSFFSHYSLISVLVLVVSITIALMLYSDFYAFLFKTSDITFGCNFTPTGYRLRDTPPRSTIDGIFSKPVWGDERTPLILKDDSELLELLEHIDEINAEVLETLPYNSFDSYIEFYESYKSSGLEFRVFYAGYQPAYRPAENCIGLAIESLNRIHTRLALRWPMLPYHTYLVSSRELTADWMTKAEWENTEEQDGDYLMMGTRQTKHLLGALKVQVNGRQGIILLDQGYAMESPIVLMSDGQSPHDNIKFASQYNEWNIYEWINENRYIMWKVSEGYDEKEPHEWHRIYVHRPYCSFLYNTEKVFSLHTTRSIVLRTREGNVVVAVYFTIQANDEIDVIFISRDQTTDDMIDHTVPMRNLSVATVENNTSTDNQKNLEIIDKTNEILGFTPGVLLEKLQKIQTILLDEEFVRGCLKLEKGEKKKN